MIPNVLANRYASAQMQAIWSPEGKIRAERQLWIAVLKAQQALGVSVKPGAIEAYEAHVDDIDLDDIAAREAITKHDVKARIESYNAAAGFEEIHKGMTSRDLTENVEQLQVKQSLDVIRTRVIAALAVLADQVAQHADTVLAARSHNVPAQPTTVGKRLANTGEEILYALNRLDDLIARYPLRGIKGPVGTQADMLTLLGSPEKVSELEHRVAEHLGVSTVLTNTGQVYPRSIDFDVVAAMHQLASGPANFARTIRLMAGQELATEGFLPGQVGSSAMPHKMNARSCERINGFHSILAGYVTMATHLTGDQWNEGDVSCSVVRRVVLPDTFFAIDGLMATFLTVLGGLGFFDGMIAAELNRTLPFLATTTMLMQAVQQGAGREQAHEVIKTHAVAAALAMREGEPNNLVTRLGQDPAFPLDEAQIEAILANLSAFTGQASAQAQAFVTEVATLTAANPEAAAWRPGAIL
ncbi:adenylosuccinate lyase [Stomatohabitans albus]|uniref:adenylosuccinate lyase n=1 Tax=Stomatohabitans albus TaxID=3110766 RepID=UPI00300D9C50